MSKWAHLLWQRDQAWYISYHSLSMAFSRHQVQLVNPVFSLCTILCCPAVHKDISRYCSWIRQHHEFQDGLTFFIVFFHRPEMFAPMKLWQLKRCPTMANSHKRCVGNLLDQAITCSSSRSTKYMYMILSNLKSLKHWKINSRRGTIWILSNISAS